MSFRSRASLLPALVAAVLAVRCAPPDPTDADVRNVDASRDGAPVGDARIDDTPGTTDAAMDGSFDVANDGSIDESVCAGLIRGALHVPTDQVRGGLSGPSVLSSTLCGTGSGSGSGPEAIYTLHLDTTMGVTFRIDPAPWVNVRVRRTCGGSDLHCYAPRDFTYADYGVVLRPGDYDVIIDSVAGGPASSYTLDLATFDVPANAFCDGATALTDGVTLHDQTLRGGRDAQICTNVIYHTYYSLELPANAKTSITALARTTGTFPCGIGLSIRTGCDDSCGGIATSFTSTQDYENTGTTPQTLIIGATGTCVDPDETFDIGATITRFAANHQCASALAVNDGDAVSVDVRRGSPLYYSITVPPDATLALDWQPDFWRVDVTDSCGGSVLTSSNVGSLSGRGVRWRNTGSSPRAVIIALQSENPLGAFDMNVHLFTAAPNSSCATATPVSDGSFFDQLEPATGAARSPACSALLDERELFYAIDIPPGMTLGVSTHSRDPGQFASVGLMSDCSSACFGTNQSLTSRNTGTTTQSVIVVVHSSAITGPISARFTLGPATSNLDCDTATPVANGTQLFGEALSDATVALPRACREFGLHYGAQVPPGSLLSVGVRDWGSSTDSIGRLDTCPATTCTPLAQGAQRFTVANTGTTPEDVSFAVYGVGGGRFDLDARIVPIPYTEQSIPTMCDDMTSAPVVRTSMSFPTSLPLPFGFDYFGEAVSYFQPSFGGYLQLLPTVLVPAVRYGESTGSPRIPDAGGNNGLVVPFRGPIGAVDGVFPRADIRAATFGAAPLRRHTVQWTNLSGTVEGGSVLTFQAKFFEATNVIEFHYCTLTPNPSVTPSVVTGVSAVIGLESIDGTLGIEHSNMRAGAVSTSSAIRFVPASP